MHLPPSRFGAPIIKPSLYRLILKHHFMQAVIRNICSCPIFPQDLHWRRGNGRSAVLLIIDFFVHHLIGAHWVRLLPCWREGDLWSRFGDRPGRVGELIRLMLGRYHCLCDAVCNSLLFHHMITLERTSGLLDGHRGSCTILFCFSRLIQLREGLLSSGHRWGLS